MALYQPIDVGPAGGQNDTGREALLALTLPRDDDTVGQTLRGQTELLLGRRRVGHRRVDFDHAHSIEKPSSSSAVQVRPATRSGRSEAGTVDIPPSTYRPIPPSWQPRSGRCSGPAYGPTSASPAARPFRQLRMPGESGCHGRVRYGGLDLRCVHSSREIYRTPGANESTGPSMAPSPGTPSGGACPPTRATLERDARTMMQKRTIS